MARTPETLDDLHPGKYLRVTEVPDSPTRVHVDDVTFVELDGQTKGVAYIREYGKGLPLNKTNSVRLATIFNSRRVKDWRGPVLLTKEFASYQGKTDLALRFAPDLTAKPTSANGQQPVHEYKPADAKPVREANQEAPGADADLSDEIPWQ